MRKYIKQTVGLDEADGEFDPPEDGYLINHIIEGHRKIVLIWVDSQYLREQTQGAATVSTEPVLEGDAERARDLAELMSAEVEK